VINLKYYTHASFGLVLRIYGKKEGTTISTEQTTEPELTERWLGTCTVAPQAGETPIEASMFVIHWQQGADVGSPQLYSST
jgi:hypothetical protein